MNTVKVGQLPGKLNEFAFEAGTTVAQALETAGLSAEGFEVKVDGNTVSDLNTAVDGANLVLLTKKIKGNVHTVKVGQLPGKLEEYTFEPPTSVQEVLNVAGLNPEGFEVKVDGNTVTDFSQEIGTANLVLLTKKIKGNM